MLVAIGVGPSVDKDVDHSVAVPVDPIAQVDLIRRAIRVRVVAIGRGRHPVPVTIVDYKAKRPIFEGDEGRGVKARVVVDPQPQVFPGGAKRVARPLRKANRGHRQLHDAVDVRDLRRHREAIPAVEQIGPGRA